MARELFLFLASTRYDLTPLGNSMNKKTEDKLALCLCNTGAVLRVAVTGVFASLTLRRLISYIYMEHPFLMFLDHTQRRSTVGRTPLDE